MIIKDQLRAIPLPVICRREGKDCYYDPYRQKLVEVTPEEMVRQKITAFYEKEYDVPKDMFWLEVPMSYYIRGSRGRADVIIHGRDEMTGELYPIGVIECKNEETFLTDQTADQAIRYCDLIGGRYILLTNGVELKAAVYDQESDSYIYMDHIPTYEEMLGEEMIPELEESNASSEDEFVRFTMVELNDQALMEQYNDEGPWIFGLEAPSWLKSFSVNLFQCLLDTDHILPPYECPVFELIQDVGLRDMDYVNGGGGHFHGLYRSFLVKDRFGEMQLISMSVFGTDPDFRGENRKSYTLLNVAVDTLKTSHNVLQYNLDKYACLTEDSVKFYHNGRMGRRKKSQVLDTVQHLGAGLKLDHKGIFIGELPTDRLLYLDDKKVCPLIYNLIEYTLLRDEVRKKKD